MFEQERKSLMGLAMVAIIAIILIWVSNEDYKHEVEMAIPRNGMRGSLAGLLANQSKL